MTRQFRLRTAMAIGVFGWALFGAQAALATMPDAGKSAIAAAGPSLHAAVERALYAIEPAATAGSEPTGKTTYRANNRAQGFSTTFGPDGFRVRATKNGDSFEWGLQLTALGRGAGLAPVEPPTLVSENNRIAYRRGNLTEWYVNDSRGVEQGFTLAERPPGADSEPLRVELTVVGDLVPLVSANDSADEMEFGRAEGGAALLRYQALIALDATGQQIPAEMQRVGRGVDTPVRLHLVVADAAAVYPLTIDPLVVLAETKLTASDAAAHDSFGGSVSISGDTAVVGARLDDDAGTSSGSAYVFDRDQGGTDAWGQVTKLTASDAAAYDSFGISVAISGDTAIVGAYLDDDDGSASGSAYVFVRDQGGTDAWGQVTKLTASDAAAGDFFGYSVAISGDTAVVGAQNDDDAGGDSGSAYVFVRDQGGTDAWGEVAKLTASDAAANDLFGTSVAISGDTAVVGADGGDDAGTDSGSAYVFARDQGGTDAWGEVTKLTASDAAAEDYFGCSVAISDDTAVVGAYLDDDAGSSSGSAYVFVRDQGGTDAWGEVTKLTASDAAASDLFGISVAISGDKAIVGADGDDDTGSSSGSAYVFVRDQGGTDAWGEATKLTASDAASGDLFGYSISISSDTAVVGAYLDDVAGSSSGSAYLIDLVAETKLIASDPEAGAIFGLSTDLSGHTAIVGAHRDDGVAFDSGSAYVFGRDEGGVDAWGEVTKLTASDGAAEDTFGSASAISGDTAIVGAAGDDDAGSASGSAYLFGRNEGGADTWGEVTKLTASDADAGDRFGVAVAISADTAVAGAYQDDDAGVDSGSAYVFERDQGGTDAWGEVTKLTASDGAAGDYFGLATAVSADTAVVGAYLDGAGSAYVFERDQGGTDAWGETTKLTASDGAAGDYFGYSVAIFGDTAVIGAYLDSDAGNGSGAAYVFDRDEGGAGAWGEVAKLTAADATAGDLFGVSVRISGNLVLVGAYRDDDGGSNAGSAYVFDRDEGGTNAWGQIQKLTAFDAADDDNFGFAVALSGSTALVGAREDDHAGGNNAGSAYVFDLGGSAVECSNGLDDDGDGLSDYPGDPGCSDASDLSERSPLLVCDDGADNDADGLADFDPETLLDASAGSGDPGCADPSDNNEDPACQDGLNNDSDLVIDFDGGQSIWGACTPGPGGCPPEVSDPDDDGIANPDPTCIGRPWFRREGSAGCGVGGEIVIGMAALMVARSRRRRFQRQS